MEAKEKDYRRRVVTLVAVIFFLLLNFWFAVPALASDDGQIIGQVFEDLNFNNQLDYDEISLANWAVVLYQDENLIKSGLTDTEGRYAFGDLAPGTYRVEAVVPEGFAATNGNQAFVWLINGGEEQVDFAMYQVAREKGNVYEPMMQLHTFNIEVLSPTAVKISWHTSHPATSQVVFDQNSILADDLKSQANSLGYAQSSPVDFDATTFHSVILTNLEPETSYYFRTVSLPDPRQWCGADKVFSQELDFVTPAQVLPQVSQPTVQISQPLTESKLMGQGEILGLEPVPKILAEDFKEELPVVIDASSSQEVVVEGFIQPDEGSAAALADCRFYIWLALLLNFLVVGFLRFYSRVSTDKLVQRSWWIGSIFILVPFFMGYPECWLTVWLTLTLIGLALFLFSVRKKFLNSLGRPTTYELPKSEPETFFPNPSRPAETELPLDTHPESQLINPPVQRPSQEQENPEVKKPPNNQ